MSNKLTKEQALELLEKSCTPWEEDGITHYYNIGEFIGTFTSIKNDEPVTSFYWLVYPYTTNEPVNPNYAYVFYVSDTDDPENIIHSSNPFYNEEVHRLRKLSFRR